MIAISKPPPRPVLLSNDRPTDAMRAYLLAIYDLASRQEPVIGARLAAWLNVTPPTVTAIVQRMEERGYITRGARNMLALTGLGYALAEEIIVRHHLLECFLARVLTIPWRLLHLEAMRLEPTLSPTLEKRIAALAGEVTTCPHGNPIPGRPVDLRPVIRLDRINANQDVTLSRIAEEAEQDEGLLAMFESHNLLPGRRFTVTGHARAGDALLRCGSQTLMLAPSVTRQIWVVQV